VFSLGKTPTTLTLCVDEAFPGLNQLGRGRPLFTPEGKPTRYVESVLGFLREYVAQAERTRAFCKKLVDLKRLEPMRAQFTLGSGEKASLRGFMAVDRNKLKGLAGEALAEMAKTDELELLNLHLHPMRNFVALKNRLVQNAAGEAPGGANSESRPAAREGRSGGTARPNAELARPNRGWRLHLRSAACALRARSKPLHASGVGRMADWHKLFAEPRRPPRKIRQAAARPTSAGLSRTGRV
jgi:hypothetical protein